MLLCFRSPAALAREVGGLTDVLFVCLVGWLVGCLLCCVCLCMTLHVAKCCYCVGFASLCIKLLRSGVLFVCLFVVCMFVCVSFTSSCVGLDRCALLLS